MERAAQWAVRLAGRLIDAGNDRRQQGRGISVEDRELTLSRCSTTALHDHVRTNLGKISRDSPKWLKSLSHSEPFMP